MREQSAARMQRILAMLLGALACAGCESQTRTAASRPPGPNASAAIFTTPAMSAWERSGNATAPADRWEFARRDDSLSATTHIPILGTQQWPLPPRPQERRVRFRHWEQ